MIGCRLVRACVACAAVLFLTLLPAWSVFGETISYTSGAAQIYGKPTVLGDTLLFDPGAYSSHCSGAQGVDMVDGLLRVWIKSGGILGLSTSKRAGHGSSSATVPTPHRRTWRRLRPSSSLPR